MQVTLRIFLRQKAFIEPGRGSRRLIDCVILLHSAEAAHQKRVAKRLKKKQNKKKKSGGAGFVNAHVRTRKCKRARANA